MKRLTLSSNLLWRLLSGNQSGANELIATIVFCSIFWLIGLMVAIFFIRRKVIISSSFGQRLLQEIKKQNETIVTDLAKSMGVTDKYLRRRLFFLRPLFIDQIKYVYLPAQNKVVCLRPYMKATETMDSFKRSSDTPERKTSSPELVASVIKTSADGLYTEELPSGGKLNIKFGYWYIEYYFPGPDRRYNGTFFRIAGDQIEKYIDAWIENFKKYTTIKNQFPTDGVSFNGKKGMKISINKYPEGVALTSYHLAISKQEHLDQIVSDYVYCKKKAQAVFALLNKH